MSIVERLRGMFALLDIGDEIVDGRDGGSCDVYSFPFVYTILGIKGIRKWRYTRDCEESSFN